MIVSQATETQLVCFKAMILSTCVWIKQQQQQQ